jgi:phosphohistidine phosphatase SixA
MAERAAGPGTRRARPRVRVSLAPVAGAVAAVILVGVLSLTAALAAEPVWDALRAPGAVVIVRHSFAPGAFDPPNARLDDCSTQRNLDETGRAQARRIGEAFRKNGIAVGTVLSSPRCRCMDTARLAFGSAQPMAALGGALRDQELRQRQLAEIRKRIAAHASGPPLVLVTHGIVITDLTGLRIDMGAFVVVRRGADGDLAVAGQLHVD